MLRFLFVLVLTSACLVTAYGQKIATLEIELAAAAQGLDVPVQTNLDAITFLSDTLLNLVEVQGGKKVPVKFQIESGAVRTLHWIVTPNDKVKKYSYELVKGAGGRVESAVQV